MAVTSLHGGYTMEGSGLYRSASPRDSLFLYTHIGARIPYDFSLFLIANLKDADTANFRRKR